MLEIVTLVGVQYPIELPFLLKKSALTKPYKLESHSQQPQSSHALKVSSNPPIPADHDHKYF